MKRGEIWTVSGRGNYASKPRPVVIVQDDRFDMLTSITLAAFTTDTNDLPLFRIAVEPNERNGLRRHSRVMIDKITTVPRSKLGTRIGCLAEDDLLRLNQAMLVFLGLTVSPKTGR